MEELNREEIKKIVREELKDLSKTLNRVYEDRDILLDLKVKIEAIEALDKEIKERVFKLERNVRVDLADHQEKLEDQVSEVKDALNKVEETIGGESYEQS